jgi:serine acetyltransferase
VVGDNVLLGAGAKVLGPVRLGCNVNVGANAVVLSDVPNDSTVGGVPARILVCGGQRVGVLGQGGELAGILKDIQERLDRLETRESATRSGGSCQ